MGEFMSQERFVALLSWSGVWETFMKAYIDKARSLHSCELVKFDSKEFLWFSLQKYAGVLN